MNIFNIFRKTTLLISLALAMQSFAFAHTSVEQGYYIFDSNHKILNIMNKNPELTIDHVGEYGFEVYGPAALSEWIKALNVQSIDLNANNLRLANDYPAPEEIEQKMEALHAQYPKLTQLIEVGKSVRGRRLLFMKLSSKANEDRVLPEVKYISSMHGDEITGRELMIYLIEDLLKGYGTNPEITQLLDNTEVFIMPSMNPDGSAAKRRGNANNYDLNRSFPDFTTGDNTDKPTGRPTEVQAIMNFQSAHQIALSANFHGGAEVVNYPWDTQLETFPFFELVKGLSLNYANRVDYIKNSTEFGNGITNGYEWYEVNGGMQDWSYYWHNDLQLTIELSTAKWPNFSNIPQFYADNKPALINFLENVHQGAGFYFANNKTESGTVEIFSTDAGKNLSLGKFGFSGGEFYKVLDAGNYHMVVRSNSGAETSFNASVAAGKVITGGNYKAL